MPNIPPLVSYFSSPFTNASGAVIPPKNSLYVELQGQGGQGEFGPNITTLSAGTGFTGNGTTGNVELTNSGINALAGSNGLACIIDNSQNVTISYPAVGPGPSFSLPSTPAAFAGSNIVSIPVNGAAQMFQFTLGRAATYCKMTMEFAPGTSGNAYPQIYTTFPRQSRNDTYFFLSPTPITNSVPVPPTYVDNTPNTYYFPEVLVDNFVTIPPSGGSEVPSIMTLEMNSPTATSNWYVGIGQNGFDPGAVFWDTRVISLVNVIARGESAVEVPFAS